MNQSQMNMVEMKVEGKEEKRGGSGEIEALKKESTYVNIETSI